MEWYFFGTRAVAVYHDYKISRGDGIWGTRVERLSPETGLPMCGGADFHNPAAAIAYVNARNEIENV